MSGPVPSPTMKGMIGSSGTIIWPEASREIFRPDWGGVVFWWVAMEAGY